MEIVNHTHFAADYTTASDRSGRDHLLLVVKATYHLPLRGEPAQLLERQLPPVVADTATGEPGFSAPEYECEYVLTKPRCDVLLLGSAYAPNGTPAQRVVVGLKIGAIRKTFHVYGKRAWQAGMLGIGPGPAGTFTRQAISYDLAFGGVENNPDNPDNCAVYPLNPIGTGYQKHLKPDLMAGRPMPQTEAIDAPVTYPNGSYQPMSFGPLGRHWAQRVRYAGTYDERWREEVFPFLPPDFDERYFQSAPEDQQIATLHGSEIVTLLNLTPPALTPSGRLDFTLPDLSLATTFHPGRGAPETLAARVDTLLIEPDQQRFSVTWRAARPLRRVIDEVDSIEIGAPAQHQDPAPCCCDALDQEPQ